MCTGCQWPYQPESFGPWARVWSQFAAGHARELGASTHAAAREALDVTASLGGCPGRAGLIQEGRASELMLEHLTQQR